MWQIYPSIHTEASYNMIIDMILIFGHVNNFLNNKIFFENRFHVIKWYHIFLKCDFYLDFILQFSEFRLPGTHKYISFDEIMHVFCSSESGQVFILPQNPVELFHLLLTQFFLICGIRALFHIFPNTFMNNICRRLDLKYIFLIMSRNCICFLFFMSTNSYSYVLLIFYLYIPNQ